MLDFNYIVEYSFNGGVINDTVGCHTEKQAHMIGEAIYDGFMIVEGMTCYFVRILDKDGKVLDTLRF